jgi:predicted restriction endonuclease
MVEHSNGVSLPVVPRLGKYHTKKSLLEGKQCQVCSETRAVDVCHIIPREKGGSSEEGNYLFLCPTHHYLLDQARLTKGEFDRIRNHSSGSGLEI